MVLIAEAHRITAPCLPIDQQQRNCLGRYGPGKSPLDLARSLAGLTISLFFAWGLSVDWRGGRKTYKASPSPARQRWRYLALPAAAKRESIGRSGLLGNH